MHLIFGISLINKIRVFFARKQGRSIHDCEDPAEGTYLHALGLHLGPNYSVQ
jgi:hypothetical protein